MKSFTLETLEGSFHTCSANTGLMNDCMARETFPKAADEFAVSTGCLRCCEQTDCE